MFDFSDISDESDNDLNDFVESPGGTKYLGIEDFAKEVEYPPSELIDLFEDRLYLLLKYSVNSIEVLSEIEADELSFLSEDYLRRALQSPKNIIQLNNAGIAPNALHDLSKNYFTILLKRSSEIEKLISSGISFEQLKELAIGKLRLILSKTDNLLDIMNRDKLTFNQLLGIPVNELRTKLTAINHNATEGYASSSSSFFQVPREEQTVSKQVVSTVVLKPS